MKEKTTIGAIIFFLGLMTVASPASADPSFIERMEGLVAACRVDSTGAHTEAFLVGRDSGQASAKYKAAVKSSFKTAQACVDENKPKGRGYLRDEIRAQPDLKPIITPYYASWLGYMDWLSTPRDLLEESAEKTVYEASLNRLIAEMDAQ
ncbi:hypothetical protein AQS70_20615 [Pseudomonas endophytica]|uniref:Uncharacterized protein n=1 Tax=Pseudomonas endophytica TaxID=1563157 RepID=A0A0Q0XBI1_9PSED|nr:hypothetical protein [Pseudomonas endophytica]KQB54790.1 hypothetical protein AQS70_20615 [Pseudomonas endophytica]